LRADEATLAWILEFYGPALQPGQGNVAHQVGMAADAELRGRLRARVPGDAGARPCFAFDQALYQLPAADSPDGVTFDDAERSCAFHVSPGAVELAGEPGMRRWRFTCVLILHELIATPLRADWLELHAAAVEHDGRAILMPGPKGAGKTTLSLHFLRSGASGQMANDRVFARSDEVRGMPHGVKVLPETAAEFPELADGRPWAERPHIHTIAELEADATGPPPAGTSLMLSPAQLADRMGVGIAPAAAPAALLFPQVVPGYEGPVLEPLDEATVRSEIWSNLYGSGGSPRRPTVFEEFEGLRAEPSPDRADALAGSVAGYRVRLGRRAREDSEFGARLLDELAARA
jgi:hypothetical protein